MPSGKNTHGPETSFFRQKRSPEMERKKVPKPHGSAMPISRHEIRKWTEEGKKIAREIIEKLLKKQREDCFDREESEKEEG